MILALVIPPVQFGGLKRTQASSSTTVKPQLTEQSFEEIWTELDLVHLEKSAEIKALTSDLFLRACCLNTPGVLGTPVSVSEISKLQEKLTQWKKDLEDNYFDFSGIFGFGGAPKTSVSSKFHFITTFLSIHAQIAAASITAGIPERDLDISDANVILNLSMLEEFSGKDAGHSIISREDGSLTVVEVVDGKAKISINPSFLDGYRQMHALSQDEDKAFLSLTKITLIQSLIGVLFDTNSTLDATQLTYPTDLKSLNTEGQVSYSKMFESVWNDQKSTLQEKLFRDALKDAFFEIYYETDGKGVVQSLLTTNQNIPWPETIDSIVKPQWRSIVVASSENINPLLATVNSWVPQDKQISKEALQVSEFVFLEDNINHQVMFWPMPLLCSTKDLDSCFEQNSEGLKKMIVTAKSQSILSQVMPLLEEVFTNEAKYSEFKSVWEGSNSPKGSIIDAADYLKDIDESLPELTKKWYELGYKKYLEMSESRSLTLARNLAENYFFLSDDEFALRSEIDLSALVATVLIEEGAPSNPYAIKWILKKANESERYQGLRAELNSYIERVTYQYTGEKNIYQDNERRKFLDYGLAANALHEIINLYKTDRKTYSRAEAIHVALETLNLGHSMGLLIPSDNNQEDDFIPSLDQIFENLEKPAAKGITKIFQSDNSWYREKYLEVARKYLLSRSRLLERELPNGNSLKEEISNICQTDRSIYTCGEKIQTSLTQAMNSLSVQIQNQIKQIHSAINLEGLSTFLQNSQLLQIIAQNYEIPAAVHSERYSKILTPTSGELSWQRMDQSLGTSVLILMSYWGPKILAMASSRIPVAGKALSYFADKLAMKMQPFSHGFFMAALPIFLVSAGKNSYGYFTEERPGYNLVDDVYDLAITSNDVVDVYSRDEAVSKRRTGMFWASFEIGFWGAIFGSKLLSPLVKQVLRPFNTFKEKKILKALRTIGYENPLSFNLMKTNLSAQTKLRLENARSTFEKLSINRAEKYIQGEIDRVMSKIHRIANNQQGLLREIGCQPGEKNPDTILKHIHDKIASTNNRGTIDALLVLEKKVERQKSWLQRLSQRSAFHKQLTHAAVHGEWTRVGKNWSLIQPTHSTGPLFQNTSHHLIVNGNLIRIQSSGKGRGQ